jgi:hypothetical protein
VATLTITVPDALLPRVGAALRGQYPDLTAGLADADAARMVVRHLIRTTVIAHEARQAQQETRGAVSAAEQKAWSDTEGIGG